MKIEEILDEYIIVPDQDFSMNPPEGVNFDDLPIVGEFPLVKKNKDGKNIQNIIVIVKKLVRNHEIAFYVFHKEETIGFAILNTNYSPPRMQNANTKLEWRKTGVMIGLYTFIAREEKIKFTNDAHLSHYAELFWKSLIDLHVLKISIIDVKTGVTYPCDNFNDIPTEKTQDNINVIQPRKDIKPENEQRFFYLAERDETLDNEKILFENGRFFKESKKDSLMQPIIMFGPPWE